MAHVHHLQAEHRRRHRGAEQGGEQPRHAALDQGVGVLLVHPEEPPDPGGQTAADLQCRPLPARAAPGEVGEHRAQENQRGQPHRGAFPAPDAGNDLVCTAVVFHPGGAVAEHDGQPRQGHQKQQPGVGGAQGRRLGHAPGKRRPRPAAGQPGQPGQRQPLPQGPEGGQDGGQPRPEPVYHGDYLP